MSVPYQIVTADSLSSPELLHAPPLLRCAELLQLPAPLDVFRLRCTPDCSSVSVGGSVSGGAGGPSPALLAARTLCKLDDGGAEAPGAKFGGGIPGGGRRGAPDVATATDADSACCRLPAGLPRRDALRSGVIGTLSPPTDGEPLLLLPDDPLLRRGILIGDPMAERNSDRKSPEPLEALPRASWGGELLCGGLVTDAFRVLKKPTMDDARRPKDRGGEGAAGTAGLGEPSPMSAEALLDVKCSSGSTCGV